MDNLFERLSSLYDEGNLRQAQKELQRILKEDPLDVTANFYMALILLRDKRCEEALNHALRVHRLEPHEPNINLNLGCIYECLGDLQRAKRYYKQELHLHPGCGEAWFNLGHRYFEAHQWKRASECFERCMALKHSVNDISPKLAYCYIKRAEIEKEIALYCELIQLDSNDSWAIQNLGASLIDIGQLDEALSWLLKAKAFGPDDEMIDRNIKKIEHLSGL
jgi:tetratricopeptide (TPR) repeat protein